MIAHKPLFVALVVLVGAAGCSGGKTETVTVTVIQDCGPGAPNGKCDSNQTCFEGACVASATLCSPTNDTGSCPSGTTCFSGGCAVTTQLCGAANPTGPCESGKTCFSGACVATSSLCSTSNTSGTCPTGQTCQAGQCAAPGVDPCTVKVYTQQPTLGVRTRAQLTVDGLKFKDSNGNGTLDPYEDWRLSELCRAKDLVSKMTAVEKIGLMGEGSTIGSGPSSDGGIADSALTNIKTLHLRQALIRLSGPTAQQLADYLNQVQAVCEAENLGIPFVVTTDPVHGFGMSTAATDAGVQSLSPPAVVSPWPYPMGLGAANDVALSRQYGDTVRREFMAMGFRWQLGPMADVATEPRWARVQNTFGENAFAVGYHTKAVIEGFQGDGLDGGMRNAIAATIKHFPGAGADEEGKDSHSRPGHFNVFPGGYFTYHQIAFRTAMAAKPAALMPCYSIFKNQFDWDPEQTGSAFSHHLITDYLKTEIGFDGMVTSDWGTMSSTAWGVESLTQPQRVALFLHAGSHQLGSDSVTLIQTAYGLGLVTDADLDAAATKILEVTFKLGMFENPYVDPAAPESRSQTNMLAGFVAQKKAIVILKNREHASSTGAKYLPISGAKLADGGMVDDTNGNGSVEVAYDGVVDSLSGSDVYDPFLNPYDYTSATGPAPDGGVLGPVAQATSAATADVVVVRITARKGTYFGLDRGVPLSFDAPFPGVQADTGYAAGVRDAHRMIDLFRLRDGYKDSTGAAVAAVNPKLKIVMVVHLDRPAILKPFVNGLVSLDELPGVPNSYPLVSNDANIRADGLGGVDAVLIDFGAYDRAVLDVVFNKNAPTTPAGYVYGSSRLPIELPSSDSEVAAQFEDVPSDTKNPTYAQGAGSTY